MIVLLAEMAEPDMAKDWCGIIGQCIGTVIIAEMTVRSQNAILQILRIRSLLKHLHAMVCLYHQIVGTTDKIVHLLGDMPHISNETEGYASTLYKIAHIISTVMRHPKRSHLKFPHIERYIFLDDMHMIGRNFLSDAIIALDTYMNFTGCIYW